MRLIAYAYITLLGTAYSFSQGMTFDWAIDLDGPSSDIITGVAVDSAGNSYVSGYFVATVDFDPGPAVYNVTPTSSQNGYILKLDHDGNYLWVKTFDGTPSYFRYVTLDDQNNIYLAGGFSGTLDLDPGVPVNNVTSSSMTDGLVIKLNQDGEFMWGKQFEGVSNNNVQQIKIINNELVVNGYYFESVDLDPGAGSAIVTRTNNGNYTYYLAKYNLSGDYLWSYTNEITTENFTIDDYDVDSSGNLYLSGSFKGGVDFDPSVASFVLSATNNNNFILKLNSVGTFVWVKTFVGNSYCSPTSLVIDPWNDIYVCGMFQGIINLSFTSTPNNKTSAGSYDTYLVKMDSDANIKWVNCIGGSGWDAYDFIKLDKWGYPYIFGRYENAIDIDPTAIVETTPIFGNQDLFVQKLHYSGFPIWTTFFGTPNDDQSWNFLITENNSALIAGSYKGTIDFDPSPSDVFNLSSSGSYYDPFLTSWSLDSCGYSVIFIDSTANLQCPDIPGYAAAELLGGIGSVSYTWNSIPPTTGSVFEPDIPGIYTITTIDSTGCSNAKSVLVNGPSISSLGDLGINITSTPITIGSSSTIWIDVYGASCDSNNALICFAPAPGQSLLSSSPLADSTSGDTLFWHLTDLFYNDDIGPLKVIVYNTSTLILGDNTCLFAAAVPSLPDFNMSNNSELFCTIVSGSYDPNDKKVSPQGICDPGFVTLDEALRYTVRFQNTGTATAVNVVIEDSISSEMDINTLNVIYSSHNLVTEIDANKVRFVFNNIFLPDSNSDESGSHGYVIYEIYPDSGIASGTTVSNMARIYFDINEPIETNEVTNRYVNSLPIRESSITEYACGGYELNGLEYDHSGIYTQVLESTLGSCDSVITLTLQLFNGSNAIWQSNDTLYAMEGISYQWIDCSTGDILLGQTSQYLVPGNDGAYAVIWEGNSCIDTSSCFTYNYYQAIPETENYCTIFPNPLVNNMLTISFKSVQYEISYRITDILGKLVFEGVYYDTSSLELDLGSLSPAKYFLVVKSTNTCEVMSIIKY